MTKTNFPKPQNMERGNGRARFAYATLFTLNDSYLPAVLLLAYGLRRQNTKADLICLVTPEITCSARKALRLLYDVVLEVEPIVVPHKLAGKRPYLPLVFTKLHVLRLGADGDLGRHYDKIILLDADLLPQKHYDHLFTLPAPAGSINEHKTHVMEWGADGNFIIPDSVYQDGTWNWHQIYANCPHGRPIPKEITDRVADDPSNMGIISSLLILEPSLAEYAAIRQDLERPQIQQLVGQQFTWPEMQYLTLRWSGQWTNVDLRFHSLNGYPDLSVLFGIHYTGFKPWQFRKQGSMERYGRRADFQHWYEMYGRMMKDYPTLHTFKKLCRLQSQIEPFQA
ncbi:MAG: hypothetical protein GY796_27825 [Chloroflexi bacterium]|nr:hypothetical protein [Chloroflexota bacterium]